MRNTISCVTVLPSPSLCLWIYKPSLTTKRSGVTRIVGLSSSSRLWGNVVVGHPIPLTVIAKRGGSGWLLVVASVVVSVCFRKLAEELVTLERDGKEVDEYLWQPFRRRPEDV